MNRIMLIRIIAARLFGMFVATSMVAAISLPGVVTQKAYAHGTEIHENKRRPDNALKQVHGLMSIYEDCVKQISEALKVEDTDVLFQQGAKLLAASRELIGANPYKSGNQAKLFKKQSQEFEREVAAMLASASQGDSKKTSVMFKRVEQKCLSCHAILY